MSRVVDGDTIDVTPHGRVRLIGVDTPEPRDARPEVRFMARQASTFTRSLVLDQTVRLEFEGTLRDRYGRLLAYVHLEDGRLLNAEIIREGYGAAYTRFPFRRLDEFVALEREARREGRGLWKAEATP